MLITLLHSSKTMKVSTGVSTYQKPLLMDKAEELANYIQTLSARQLQACMMLSQSKALKTHELWQAWSKKSDTHLPAVDSFIGDIYSGLQVPSFTAQDRQYANDHLYILSGLYGVLRALDSIAPYRLEMAYKLPRASYKNLYSFWGDSIAQQIPTGHPIINLSSLEYAKAVLPYFLDAQVITPKFMTMGSNGQPRFVVVHAKIARGAFARWLMKSRIANVDDILHFSDLNYRYNAQLSTSEQPVFICDNFGGLGLSVRLMQ